jgi:hypothetical protein
MSLHSAAALPSSSRQRWFVLFLVLFFVALGLQYTVKALHHRSAFQRWREQILSLDDGEDIYQRFAYPNPPIMALILDPFAQLPPLVGALCWFYLKVAMTLVTLYWVFRLVEDPARPFPPWAKALTVLLSLRPIMGDLSHGNVNLFILFVVVGALYAYRRGRDVLAGIVLALAIACKVTPALLVPYFLWKRAWRPLAGCTAGLVLFLWLVPGLSLGFEQNARLLISWRQAMVDPYLIGGFVTTEHPNQSLPGVVFRLGTHSPSFLTYEDNQPVALAYHNLIALEPRQARRIVQACMALFAGMIIWTCRTPTTPRHGWRLAAEFSLVLVGMLLFSERTWKHHCVTFVVPFAVLCYYLAMCRPSPLLRGYLVASLIAVTLLMAATSTSLFERAAKLAQVYGAYVGAYVVLLAALVVILRRSATPALALFASETSESRSRSKCKSPLVSPSRL